MAKKKTEKIPYQEYQKLKEKAAKRFFKLKLYPGPVLAALLVPLSIFILMIIYYFTSVSRMPE